MQQSKDKYSVKVTSRAELNKFEGMLKENVFSVKFWNDNIKPEIEEVLGMENKVKDYRAEAVKLKEGGSSEEEFNNEKADMMRGIVNNIDACVKLNKVEKTIKIAGDSIDPSLKQGKNTNVLRGNRNKAIKSINNFIIDNIFAREIAGLYEPDKTLLNLNLTPPMKLLEENMQDQIEKMWELLSEERNVNEEILQKIESELSINN